MKDKENKFTMHYDPSLDSSTCNIEKRYKLFIDNKWQCKSGSKSFKSINPSTGETLSVLTQSSKSDVELAVKSSKSALIKWQKLSPMARGKYLFKIARIIQERAKELAVLETMDVGKPIKDSRDFDIPQAAATFFYYAGWADKIHYLEKDQKLTAQGVCGLIIPWNFPLLMAAWKIAPALAAGCTCILKPSEQTSLTAMVLAEIFEQAGLPKGVVNIITGDGRVGEMLCAAPKVSKIAFTGSTEVGKKITIQTAGTNKSLSLELGGKSAHLIFEDAAINQAVESVVNGVFFNAGQVCSAGSRVLVQESIYTQFMEKLDKRIKTLRVGNPLDKNTDIGAINSKEQLKKINTLVDYALQEGGTIHKHHTNDQMPSKGYFYPPSYFTNTSSSNTINCREVFGPVFSIQTFRDEQEAIKKANETNYGLAAGVWSQNSARLNHVSSQLRAGVVWTNCYNKFDPSSPFGGVKESGQGRDGGVHGLYNYLKPVIS
ncbi:aldehyde dehydrogenase family protein [bacterium]|nr:aldehyde dehydrogenase family protein [bacterium]